MSELESKIDLELAEFLTKLISDVFDGVATSMADQAQRCSEIQQSASLDLREYALKYISDEQLETALAVLFPWENNKHRHAIFDGAPYQPKEEKSKESPSIRELTGLKLDPSDYMKKKRSGFILKTKGVEKIFETVRLRLAAAQHQSLGAMVKNGLPTIVVDSGRILSKVTFATSDVNKENMKSVAEPKGPKSETLMTRFDRTTIPATMSKLLSPGLKIFVKQADEKAPQSSEKTVNVYGEVEITFKTIN